MKTKRFRVLLVVFLLAVGVLPVTVAGVGAVSPVSFESAESNCEAGIVRINVIGPSDAMRDSAAFAPVNALITASDAEGTFLGSKPLSLPPAAGIYAYTIQYLVEPVDSVTFKLYLMLVDVNPVDGDSAAVGSPGDLMDVITVPVECGMPLPGCDVLINIPSDSVVGAFKESAPTHWAPGKQTEPVVMIPGGQSAWVIGQDEAEEYYKIVWVCQYLWVHKDTMGPNFDEVWNGAPLPTRIVE